MKTIYNSFAVSNDTGFSAFSGALSRIPHRHLRNGVPRRALAMLIPVFLMSCASLERHGERIESSTNTLETSFLATDQAESPSGRAQGALEPGKGTDSNAGVGVFTALQALPPGQVMNGSGVEFEKTLPQMPLISMNADAMPIREFIHYVFGDLLRVEYVVDPSVKGGQPITLSTGGAQSPQRIYRTAIQVLARNGLDIQIEEGVHFLHQQNGKGKKGKGANVAINIGRDIDTVPNVAGEILQVVPLRYGANISLERTLRELLDVKVTLDTTQNALFLRGERQEIVKALGFVGMFDAPANRGRYIGLVKLTYLTTDEFTKQIQALMKAEGIPVGSTGKSDETVVLVPLPNIGSSAVFANSSELLDRVRYWATLLDQPAAGSNDQYFVFYPQFARAEEIGVSLQQLLGAGGSTSGGGGGQSAMRGQSTGQAPNSQRAQGFNTDTLRMVVVERSNSLVFYTSGTEYQGLLPLLNQLDVLPKQVVLDIVIAEVTLKDEFKFGFEWALQNSEVSLSTLGALGASTIGGTALAINGSDGELITQVLQTSQLVNVLSNPTMLVRDGVTANINVGSDISVVGATTFDPINGQRQTTASTYRKTGVDVTVTPTINAEGVVLMNVSKRISNAVPNSTGAGGNPDVFERSIKTEVVAASGQTVLLGGLISEDVSASGAGTPGLSSVPILGWLFKSEGDSGSRTELVMLITPRILDDLSAWENLESKFSDGLRYLDLSSK